MSADILQRVWRFIEPEPMSGCWIWLGARDRDGYGQFGISSHRRAKAHRLVYTLLRGEIPDQLPLDHLCRVRACVNPDHLEPVPMRVNIMRGEGLAARNARQECCPQGHAYKAYAKSRGPQRVCLECARRWKQNRRAAGLCRNCSGAVVPGRAQCAAHLAYRGPQRRRERVA